MRIETDGEMMLRRAVLVCASSILIASAASAASWTRSYSPTGNIMHVDRGGDGTVLFAIGGQNPFLMRVDERNGDVLRALKAPSPWDADSVIASGTNLFIRGGDKPSIIKLDSKLQVQWGVTLSIEPPRVLPGAVATEDGGLVIVGRRDQASLAMKIAANGTLAWYREFDATGYDYFGQVIALPNGELMISGASARKQCLVKLSASGALLSARKYAGTGSIDVLMAGPEGSVVMTGSSGATSQSDLPTASIARISATGDVLWQLGAVAPQMPKFRAASVAPDGTIVAATEANAENTMYIVRFSMAGEVISAAEYAFEKSPTFNNTPTIVGAADGQIFVTFGSRILKGHSVGVIAALDGNPDGRSCTPPRAIDAQFAKVSLVANDLAFDITNTPPASTAIQSPRIEETVIKTEVCPAEFALMRTKAGPDLRRGYDAIMRARSALAASVIDLLVKRQFRELDSMATTFRKTADAQLGPLFTKLDQFYYALTIPGLGSKVTLDAHEALLQSWRESEPASTAAWVATAGFYLQRAIGAAGLEGHKPTESGVRSFEADIEKARDALKKGSAAALVDPYYFVVAFGMADDKEARELLEQARQVPPLANLYSQAMNVIGDDERHLFLDEATRATRSMYGEGVYAEFARSELMPNFKGNLEDSTAFKKTGLDWARMKQGYRDLIERFPEWVPLYHRFASAAVMAGDRETARELFARPELELTADPDPSYSWTVHQNYEAAKKFATEQPLPAAH